MNKQKCCRTRSMRQHFFHIQARRELLGLGRGTLRRGWCRSCRRLRCGGRCRSGSLGCRSGSLLDKMAVWRLHLAGFHICLGRLRVCALGLGSARGLIQLHARRRSLLFDFCLGCCRCSGSGSLWCSWSCGCSGRSLGSGRELRARRCDEKSERCGCSRDAHSPASHCIVHGIDLQWLVPV